MGIEVPRLDQWNSQRVSHKNRNSMGHHQLILRVRIPHRTSFTERR